MHLEEKTIASESVYKGKIFEVTKDKALLENGSQVQRDVVHHSGGVAVIPVTENNEILMVRQYRYPHHKAMLEIPAGKIERGEKHYDAADGSCWRKRAHSARYMNISEKLFLHRLM